MPITINYDEVTLENDEVQEALRAYVKTKYGREPLDKFRVATIYSAETDNGFVAKAWLKPVPPAP